MPLRIVVPLDGSEPSTHAVTWALAFARRTHANVSVCSVVDPEPACMAIAGGAMIDPGPMLQTLEDDAARLCAAATALAEREHIVLTSAVLEGEPAGEIAVFARAAGADLIVLGTHARHGLARGFLGSVTAAVVRSGPIAAVTVRTETRLDNAGPIVVAVDDSEASAAALRFALKLAPALGVGVHLVHVAAGGDDLTGRHVLDASANAAAAAGVACTAEIRHGAPVAALLEAVAAHNGSLLATGTHGRGAVGRLLLGSVAEGVMRESTVPVLIVHAA